jgi:hypothetical protein
MALRTRLRFSGRGHFAGTSGQTDVVRDILSERMGVNVATPCQLFAFPRSRNLTALNPTTIRAKCDKKDFHPGSTVSLPELATRCVCFLRGGHKLTARVVLILLFAIYFRVLPKLDGKRSTLQWHGIT